MFDFKPTGQLPPAVRVTVTFGALRRLTMAKSDVRPILLVEDNGDDVVLFKRALKKAGLSNPLYVVSDVHSARQHLKAKTDSPSVRFVDFLPSWFSTLSCPDGTDPHPRFENKRYWPFVLS